MTVASFDRGGGSAFRRRIIVTVLALVLQWAKSAWGQDKELSQDVLQSKLSLSDI